MTPNVIETHEPGNGTRYRVAFATFGEKTLIALPDWRTCMLVSSEYLASLHYTYIGEKLNLNDADALAVETIIRQHAAQHAAPTLSGDRP